MANAAIETHSVITVGIMRPVSTTFGIVLNCFIFLAAFQELQFRQEHISQFQMIFISDVTVALTVAFTHFFFIYTLSLYLIGVDRIFFF